MNPQQFFSRWISGIKNLSPAQQLHSKLVGNWGQLIGMAFAFIVLLYKGYWYFLIFMAFALFLQIITLIEVNQQYKNYLLMIDNFKK